MNDAEQIEYRNLHEKDASSIWTPHGLVRATDQALIISLLTHALDEWKERQ